MRCEEPMQKPLFFSPSPQIVVQASPSQRPGKFQISLDGLSPSAGTSAAIPGHLHDL